MRPTDWLMTVAEVAGNADGVSPAAEWIRKTLIDPIRVHAGMEHSWRSKVHGSEFSRLTRSAS
jgi:hypothetical protein